MKKEINEKIVIASIILIFLIIYRKWIFSLGIITHGDWPFFFKETMSTLRFNYFSSWFSDFSFGRVLFDLGQAPTYFLYGFLSKIFYLDFAVSERLIHLWPIVFVSLIGCILFFKQNFRSPYAIFIGTMAYCFNTYILINQTGHITLATAFSFFPLIFYFFKKSMQYNKIKDILITVLIGFICSSYEPRAFYIISFAIFSYFLFSIITCLKDKDKNIKQMFKTGIIILTLILLLNVYWVLTLYESKSLLKNEIFNRGLFGNQYWNILYSFTLHHPWWSGNYIIPFINQNIPFYFWILPIFIFLGIVLNQKNKDTIFFIFITLIGIFLSKQITLPFSSVYPWLYNHLPGFNAFREASKFYSLIALGYSFLLANFIEYLETNSGFDKSKYLRFLKIILIIFIASILLWNVKPIITGEIGKTFISREIPQDYIVFNNFLKNEQKYSRNLWTPRDSRWSIFTNNHPKISNIDIIQNNWKNFIDYKNHGINWPIQEQIADIFKKDYSDNLLDVSSIKYVIIPLRDTKNDDDFFVYYGNSSEFFIKILDNQKYLKKIDIGTKEILIYENEGYLNHVYISSINQSLINLDKSKIKDIDIEFINPAHYKIKFKEDTPFYLYFSDAYHDKWKLTNNNFKWYKGFWDKYYLFDDTHFKSYEFLNGWYINPTELNKNSNGEYELNIYFKPQSYLYLGLIISITTLAGCVIYLIFILIKNQQSSKS